MEVKHFPLNAGIAESFPETSVGTCRLIMVLISNNIITSKYTSSCVL